MGGEMRERLGSIFVITMNGVRFARSLTFFHGRGYVIVPSFLGGALSKLIVVVLGQVQGSSRELHLEFE